MAKTINRLSARTAQAAKEPGLLNDGGGLYLQVTKASSKSWLFRYSRHGKAREMGLGSTQTVSLEAARKAALACRERLQQGLDPIDARDAAKRAQALERALSAAKTKTFDECALAYIEGHRAGWKNAKHAAQWQATLNTYASPVIGAIAVKDIDSGLVLKVLDPIWRTKTETASRVRGRIESVLAYAAGMGYRSRENPAIWRNNLDAMLPVRSKVAKVKHHEALPYADVGGFMKELRACEGVAPKALEFIILTAARVSEAVNATWPEIDEENKIWTVPAERMKAGRDHRVPLSDAALKVLSAMKDRSESEYIFPGWKVGRPLTGAACLKLLHDMGRPTLTIHGFRSTFRDWTAEQSNFPREVAEAALAHVLSDKTEAAYQRGDLMDKRRLMMQAWANACAGSGKVLRLSRAA